MSKTIKSRLEALEKQRAEQTRSSMYMLFAGSTGNPTPGGGWQDFIYAYRTLEEAVAEAGARSGSLDWWHIVCDWNIVAERPPSDQVREGPSLRVVQ